MAYPSVTHTFTNGTTASATQVNQNFADLVAGLSDGTKDLSVSALTAAGTATLNGHVNLGNASGDDLSITASLATSLAIKTNNSFDIGGAGLGLASLYLGAPSSRSTRLRANQSLSGSHTLILPDGNGTSRYYMETDGSGNLSWTNPKYTGTHALNYSLNCAVGSNALTITLKGADGNSLSSTNPFFCSFRNSTLTSGVPVTRETTSDISITISSGSTLSHTDNNSHPIYVYALDNSGTVELAVSVVHYDENALQTTTAEGGAGAADSYLLYSTTARVSKAIRLLGRLDSTQTTAGTWAAVPTAISLGSDVLKNIAFSVYKTSIMSGTGAATVTWDTKNYDTSGTFNLSTETFVVPKTGVWAYGVMLEIYNHSNATAPLIYLKKNGSATISLFGYYTAHTTSDDLRIAAFVEELCSAGDSITIYAEPSVGTMNVYGNNSYESRFSGRWVGYN